jgi:hypothetical protein
MSADLQWKEAFIQVVAGAKSADSAIKQLGLTTRKSGGDVGFLTKQMGAFASSTLSQLRTAVLSYVGVGVAIGFVTSKINEMREAEKKRAEQAKALSTSVHRGRFADPVGATAAIATAADVFGVDRETASKYANTAADAFKQAGGRGGLPAAAANRAVQIGKQYDDAGMDGSAYVAAFARLTARNVQNTGDVLGNFAATGGDVSTLNAGNAVLYSAPGGARQVSRDAEIQKEILRREQAEEASNGFLRRAARRPMDPITWGVGEYLDSRDRKAIEEFDSRMGTTTVNGRIQVDANMLNPDLKAQGN